MWTPLSFSSVKSPVGKWRTARMTASRFASLNGPAAGDVPARRSRGKIERVTERRFIDGSGWLGPAVNVEGAGRESRFGDSRDRTAIIDSESIWRREGRAPGESRE